MINNIQLSATVTLEYDELPSAVTQTEEYFDWRNNNVKRAILNGEQVWLFSACNIPNIIEFIINNNDSFSHFVELRDILYPDVDLLMFYTSIGGYSSTDGWIRKIIDYLIDKKEIIAFKQSYGVFDDKHNFPKDKELIFAIKERLSTIDTNDANKIIFPELSDCENYQIALYKESAKFEEKDVVGDLNLSSAIRTALTIPDVINCSMKFFSRTPVNERYCIIVRNNISNIVEEIWVTPTAEHTYKLEENISSEALDVEREYIKAQKKRWCF